MSAFWAIYRREIGGFVQTPPAYIFVAAFVALAGGLTFQGGGFFESSSADLTAFFALHPWLFVILAPALTMKSWAEEVRQGEEAADRRGRGEDGEHAGHRQRRLVDVVLDLVRHPRRAEEREPQQAEHVERRQQ